MKQREQTAAYVGEMAAELATMAEDSDLSFVALLLKMAASEADGICHQLPERTQKKAMAL